MAKKKAKNDDCVTQEAVNFRRLDHDCCGNCDHLAQAGPMLVCWEVDDVMFREGSPALALRICDLHKRAPGA